MRGKGSTILVRELLLMVYYSNCNIRFFFVRRIANISPKVKNVIVKVCFEPSCYFTLSSFFFPPWVYPFNEIFIW